MFSREQIFAAAKTSSPVFQAFSVPEELGGTWHGKRLTIAEYAHFQGDLEKWENEGLRDAWCACCTIFDPETNKRVFDDLDMENFKTGLIPAMVCRKAYLIYLSVNGYLDKDLEKNLPTPSGASS